MVTWSVATEQPTPIRVELVDDVGSDARESHDPGWGREPSSRRPPGVAIAIAAVVVGALVGLAVGRASTGDDSEPGQTAPPDAPSSAPVATVVGSIAPATRAGDSSPDTTGADGSSAASASAAVTSADGAAADVPTAGGDGPAGAEPSPDATIDPVATSFVDVDQRLLGTDLRLVAPQRDGSWALLDLRDGRRDEIVDRDPTSFLTDHPVAAGDGWLAYTPREDALTTAVWRDATGDWQIVRTPGPARLLRETGTDALWLEAAAPATAPDRVFELWDVADGPTGARIALPAGAEVEGSDPAGGLIVRFGGRLSRVTPEERADLGTGDVIAVNEVVLATWSCDEALSCGLEVTDRATGASRVVVVDAGERSAVLPADVAGASELSSPLSGDGARLAVNTVGPDGFELGVVDLTTGAYQRVARHSRPFPSIWTPDGRHLLHTNVGIPYAFDRVAAVTFPVAPTGQLTGWNSIAAAG